MIAKSVNPQILDKFLAKIHKFAKIHKIHRFLAEKSMDFKWIFKLKYAYFQKSMKSVDFGQKSTDFTDFGQFRFKTRKTDN